ncbi:unnamed protein product [Trichogramma brassicae]|uniref:Uncharacterized protein n=1 Tax=Trichogramma brassicae TaxID=86971 RepID=A0A6H5J591_9HYME|nr:unnamed protein product [Trichogramma brassicae]
MKDEIRAFDNLPVYFVEVLLLMIPTDCIKVAGFRADKSLPQTNEIKCLACGSSDHFHGETLSATHIIEHAIYTKDDAPINARPYRFPAALREELHRQVNEMLETGIIEASESSKLMRSTLRWATAYGYYEVVKKKN